MTAATLLLAATRLTLAVIGVLLAIARGEQPGVAVVTAVVGAVFCGFAIISTKQGRPPNPDAAAPTEPAWRVALRATYPSTIGLTALTAFALVLKPQLAALMAGLLAGLGFAAAAGAAQLAWITPRRR